MLIYLSILENEEDKQSFQQIYEENHLKMYHVAFHILNHDLGVKTWHQATQILTTLL